MTLEELKLELNKVQELEELMSKLNDKRAAIYEDLVVKLNNHVGKDITIIDSNGEDHTYKILSFNRSYNDSYQITKCVNLLMSVVRKVKKTYSSYSISLSITPKFFEQNTILGFDNKENESI